MAMIEFKNVGLCFGDHEVLRSVDFKIPHGSCTVFIGPSGHGKTSVLKMAAGLLEPSSGGVFMENKNFTQIKGKERAALLRRMGMLFQKNALFDSQTCLDNILFPLRESSTFSDKEQKNIANHYLESVGLGHVASLYPDEISGGMQKRLGIARALALDPEILIYDDPTAGLDPITSRKIVELILDLKKKKKSTVLAVTNDMNRAYQMADQMIMISNGGALVTGSPEETKKNLDPSVAQFIRGELRGPLTNGLEA